MSQDTFWKKLIKVNLITLLFIAITEYFFINVVVRKYISIDVNKLKKNTIDTFIKELDNTE